MEDEKLVDAMIMEKLQESFNHFGIEGTEEIIKKDLHGIMQERFLRVYKVLLWEN